MHLKASKQQERNKDKQFIAFFLIMFFFTLFFKIHNLSDNLFTALGGQGSWYGKL